MFSHTEIWDAIDRLAARQNLSTSGLAKAAGLDPTTFNKSKRASNDGKLRWPSTESLAKILWVTKTRFEDFVALLYGFEKAENGTNRKLPYFDEKNLDQWPNSHAHILMPDFHDSESYIFEIGKEQFQPFFATGTLLIAAPKAELRQNDLSLMRYTSGIILLCRFRRIVDDKIFYAPLSDTNMTVEVGMKDIAFIHRIVWSNHI